MANSWNTITRGMHVEIKNEGTDVWTVLDRHPQRGCWWLHRWVDGKWSTTHAHYSQLNQVPVKAGV